MLPTLLFARRFLTADFPCARRKKTEKPGHDIGNAFNHYPANHRSVTSWNIERPFGGGVRREKKENCLSVRAAVHELKFSVISLPEELFQLGDEQSRSPYKNARSARTLHSVVDFSSVLCTQVS